MSWIEALLAYLHLAAILAWVVFIGSQSALMRPQWLNAQALTRLLRVDRIARGAAVALLLTGLLRTLAGAKGAAWYWSQPLLWLKLALLAVMLAGAWRAGARVQRWHAGLQAGGSLPAAAEVDAARRALLTWSHLMVLAPLPAVMLARGLGTV